MPSINQVQKVSHEPVRVDYISKDYVAILDDLINSISGISQKWNTTDQNDPGMVLIKLMAIVGDMLFFQQDMMCLEVYPNSVTLRKNAATIYKLIGYKMRWYQSATLEANIVNTYSNGATMPRFCTFATEDNETVYTTFDQYELPSNTQNNGLETIIELVQGIPVTPSRATSNPYPDNGKPWHSIYNFNYDINDVINNRIYLKDTDIDEKHIILIDDQNEEWQLLDNIYLTKAVGRFFEFGIDVNDRAYLEIIDYWENFNINKFKIFYIKSKGTEGEIFANTLTNLTGNVWSKGGNEVNPTVYNVSNFIHFTHYDSTTARDPETPDEARKESIKYINTLDTLITLGDFERAVLREPGVANVRATDLTNDPGIAVNYALGNINMDTIERISDDTGEILYADLIDEKDVEALANHLADPNRYPLSTYQRRLADVNQDGKVDYNDLECLRQYLNPTSYYLGDINMDNDVTQEDLDLIKNYLNEPKYMLGDIDKDGNISDYDAYLVNVFLEDPAANPLDSFQLRLADVNRDGVVNERDVDLIREMVKQNINSNIYLTENEQYSLSDFQLKLADMNQDGIVDQQDVELFEKCLEGRLNFPLIELVDKDKIGYVGASNLSDVEQLPGFVVKLYILRTEAGEAIPDEVFTTMILSDLQDYKILPLTIQVDLHSIQKYYWTIKGHFLTKEPLSRDELQNILVNINNKLRHQYSVEKIDFNTLVSYKEVIETILDVDSRILMVDLDPIEYTDAEGNIISKEQLTGKYTYTVPMNDTTKLTADESVYYHFTIPNAPILPGSVMFRINFGQYTLRDNNNGAISNIDNILAKKGKIDYVTGEVEMQFNAPITDDIIIDYTHNKANVALYKNLSTQSFYFDPSALVADDLQDII